MELKDVLNDKAGFPDNLVWNMGNGATVTLGQLRGLSASQQNEISKKEKDLVDRQAAIDAADANVKKAQMSTAQLYTALTSAKEAIANGKWDTLPAETKALFGNTNPVGVTPSNDPFAALSRLEQDTLVGPLVSVVRQVREEAKKAQDAVAGNLKIQENMAKNYLNGVLEDRYDRVVPADKQDKITLESLIRSAVTSNQFSADGAPNIKWAYKQATAADSQAEHDAKVAADAVKKFQDDLAAKGQGTDNNIFVGQPNSTFGLDVHNRSGVAPQPFKNLDEAFAAAAKDKSLWTAIDGTSN